MGHDLSIAYVNQYNSRTNRNTPLNIYFTHIHDRIEHNCIWTIRCYKIYKCNNRLHRRRFQNLNHHSELLHDQMEPSMLIDIFS